MILKSVTHDLVNNTLEATWIAEELNEGMVVVRYNNAKCRNYSIEQKAEFIADLGVVASAYIAMANW